MIIYSDNLATERLWSALFSFVMSLVYKNYDPINRIRTVSQFRVTLEHLLDDCDGFSDGRPVWFRAAYGS